VPTEPARMRAGFFVYGALYWSRVSVRYRGDGAHRGRSRLPYEWL